MGEEEEELGFDPKKASQNLKKRLELENPGTLAGQRGDSPKKNVRHSPVNELFQASLSNTQDELSLEEAPRTLSPADLSDIESLMRKLLLQASELENRQQGDSFLSTLEEIEPLATDGDQPGRVLLGVKVLPGAKKKIDQMQSLLGAKTKGTVIEYAVQVAEVTLAHLWKKEQQRRLKLK